ncbi:hypothetical protein BDN72DRAFT_953780 [Pluteus cervinus]|uniref:Uncharacterized protein n=1 Tax=Pluteus cervinus TaxID=181527 RepID=A0ACD3BHF3_9AGAR|nr:hypothetical protein BDN72DRAFT_953780 [Pluteus cervinus]
MDSHPVASSSSSTVSVDQHHPHSIDKGKRRADPTERTPLLAVPTASGSSNTPDESTTSSRSTARHLRVKLLSVFLISLSTCVLAIILVALLAWSYASRAADLTAGDVLEHGLTFRGPDRLDVIKATEDGIWVNAELRIGIDAGSLIGVNTNSSGDSYLEALWKSLGRWGVRRLDRVSLYMSTLHVCSHSSGAELAQLVLPPLDLPLNADPPHTVDWLTPVSTTAFVKLTSDAETLIGFLKDSWKRGSVTTDVRAQHIIVRGGSISEHSWRDRFSRKMEHVQLALQLDIPPLAGLPKPGQNGELPSVNDILTLTSFSVNSSDSELILTANATMSNPLPGYIASTVPSLPFIVSLPGSNPGSLLNVASVKTAPIISTHPNITLDVAGTILPLPSSASALLSTFLDNYLSGQDNSITISSSILPGFSVETLFPAPHPRPQVLRDVTIRDMKVWPSGGGFITSGTVFARLYLPKGMHLTLDVFQVLPDVLVFDGEVPDDVPGLHAQTDPPLPEGAFGHIRPEDWLPALSVEDDIPDSEGSVYIITAKVTDVPLEVLPGRQKEFRSFVGKVLFGTGGALAGLLGNASVGVYVPGLPISGPERTGEFTLDGLPFRGSVRVGKKD